MHFNGDSLEKKEIDKNQDDEIAKIIGTFDPEKPDKVLLYFYVYIMKGECDKAWALFSKYSQQKILETSYDEMKESDEFYLQNEITSKMDLKKAFEENNPGLKEAFWLPFAVNSYAEFLIEYADFNVKIKKDNKALVEAVLKRTDGVESRLPFTMFYEDSSWRVGMIETADEV